MAEVRLDPRGRLVHLAAVPPARDPGNRPTEGDDWWKPLLSAAGLDLAEFSPADPEWAPPVACDARRAWVGHFPERPDPEVRVEAAAYNGRPVSFRLLGPWTRLESSLPGGGPVPLGLTVGVLGLAVLLAVRNVRRGRADVRGGVRLWMAYTIADVLIWVVGGHHAGGLRGQFLYGFQAKLGVGLAYGVTVLLMYLALEPAVRRRWPWRLTALGRAVAGRWADPMVGRDLLVGLAAGVGVGLATLAAAAAGQAAGVPVHPTTWFTAALTGQLPRPAEIFVAFINALGWSVLALCLAYVLFLAVRRSGLAWALCAAAFWAAAVPQFGPWADANLLFGLCQALYVGVWILLMARLGLLAEMAMYVAHRLTLFALLTLDPAAWYFAQGAIIPGCVIGLPALACWTAVGRPRLLTGGFFGDD
jgi:hypothetical protein